MRFDKIEAICLYCNKPPTEIAQLPQQFGNTIQFTAACHGETDVVSANMREVMLTGTVNLTFFRKTLNESMRRRRVSFYAKFVRRVRSHRRHGWRIT